MFHLIFVLSAGFGVVILKNCAGGHEQNASKIGELYGPICKDKSSNLYLGAEHDSNNVAELTAIGKISYLVFTTSFTAS